MKSTIISTCFICLVFLICSCGSTAKVPSATHLILYSIDGNLYPNEQAVKGDEHFYDYPVLGKITITDPTERQTIIDALNKSINESDGSVAACFIPRHGLRLANNGQETDYVICFECLQVYKYENNKSTQLLTSRSAATIFNSKLKDAGIKLAP